MHSRKMLVLAVAAAWAGVVGCDNTAQGVKQDAKENAAAAREEAPAAKEKGQEVAADVKDAAHKAGDAIAGAANKAGDAVAGAVKGVAPAADAAQQTLDVKTALMADSSIDASHIDVDTDAGTKTVTLKGSVPTAAQRTAAERVAHARAGGYKIRNTLTVAKK